MSDSTEDERVEELDTLESIYPELEIDRSKHTKPSARLELQVSPEAPLRAVFDLDRTAHRLSYLPPLLLDIILPELYPVEAPPVISLKSSWIPENILKQLQNHATVLWEEYGGMSMLFAYVSYLQESAETSFNITDITFPGSLKNELLGFNDTKKLEIFDRGTFDCGVCLEPKKGHACHQMYRCGHVFCKECLQDFYGNCINEGDINSVKCMAPDCGKTANAKVKKSRRISPKELLKIPLPYDQVARYAKIKRKKRIEADPSIIYCPRDWCQGAMRTTKYPKIIDLSQMDESDSEEEDKDPGRGNPNTAKDADSTSPKAVPDVPVESTRLVICEDCTFAFCKQCLASWHGDFYRCYSRKKEDLSEEDRASMNFIFNNTTPCPTCNVNCQKSYGCNHMTCAHCIPATHFCYLCSAWLDPGDVYKHFNNPANKTCYQKLMDNLAGADNNEAFRGRDAEEEARFWDAEAIREAQRIQEQEDADAAAELAARR